MRRRLRHSIGTLLLVGWCLLFLRCETTEKSMVRALYLAQNEATVTVGLLYQAPEASADASEASAAMQMRLAEESTLEKALSSVQKKLPQKADYRLCDFLIISENTSEELLSAYESIVLESGRGRAAAKASILAVSTEELEKQLETAEGLPDKLLNELKQESGRMPRLYQYRDGMFWPQLTVQDEELSAAGTSVFRKGEQRIKLDAQQTAVVQLLSGMYGTHTLWLAEEPVTIRRCSVSVTLKGESVRLRLDCQRGDETPQPGAAQCAQLARLCTQTVQSFWQQGIDLVHLQQRSALQYGVGREKITIKNDCPQLQTVVRFLPE